MDIEKALMDELAKHGTDKAKDLFLKWQESRIQARKALEWWGNLTDTQKWENRNKVTILDGRTWQNLTGREIEIIWRNCA